MPEFTCPHCHNPIADDEALLCHFCGESLGRASRGMIGGMRCAAGKWFFILGALAVAIIFMILSLR